MIKKTSFQPPHIKLDYLQYARDSLLRPNIILYIENDIYTTTAAYVMWTMLII